MGIIEKFGAEQREERKKANPSSRREGPPLKNIINDPEKFRLFGIYLEQQGDEALAVELAKGTSMDANLIDELDQKRAGFLEICDRAELICQSIDGKSLDLILEASPELKKIENMVGADGIQAVIRRQLPELAIREGADFVRIETKIKQLADAQKEIDENEKEIKAFMGKNGISEAVYKKAIESGDEVEIRAIILQKISGDKRYKQYAPKGWFGMLGVEESINEGLLTADLEREMSATITMDQVNDLLQKRELAMQSIGSVLSLTLTNHDIFKESLMKNVRSERLEKPEKDMTMNEFKEALNPDRETVMEDYKKYRKEHSKEYWLDNNTRFDEERFRSDFVRNYEGKIAKGKKGFFTNVFKGMIFRTLTDLFR